jgi:hypothetical protein
VIIDVDHLHIKKNELVGFFYIVIEDKMSHSIQDFTEFILRAGYI